MGKKDNDKFIELLDADGWHLIPKNSSKKKRKNKHRMDFMLIFLFPLLLISVFGVAYSSYTSTGNSNSKLKVATWKFQINSNNTNLEIALDDTITSNNFSTTEVIPGTNGKIDLEIDFSSTKVATNYLVEIDKTTTTVPNNLKFYTDKELTQEFNGFQGEILLENIDEPLIKTIYWKWDYTTDDETTDWSNKDIILDLIATASQKIS